MCQTNEAEVDQITKKKIPFHSKSLTINYKSAKLAWNHFHDINQFAGNSINIRYFCVTIHHWNGSRILVNSLLFYVSLNIIVHKKRHTQIWHVYDYTSTIQLNCENSDKRLKRTDDRLLCLCLLKHGTLHQQFLVLELTCWFYCWLCIPSFSFTLPLSEMFAWALCNVNPFQNALSISHFTRFCLCLWCKRDGRYFL